MLAWQLLSLTSVPPPPAACGSASLTAALRACPHGHERSDEETRELIVRGLRPQRPSGCPHELWSLISTHCWCSERARRPSFARCERCRAASQRLGLCLDTIANLALAYMRNLSVRVRVYACMGMPRAFAAMVVMAA